MNSQLWALLAVWLAYFLIHSLLASLVVKRWVAQRHPDWMPAYRLFFNAVAMLLVLPPLALTLLWRGEPLWQWSGAWYWLSLAVTAFAVFGFVGSLRVYDGQEFLGTRQLREGIRKVEDQERMHISTLHRYVRHPWYSLGLLLVWTRDMDPAFLVSALAITGYFVFGSLLEERKLMTYHGAAYREYRRRVPGLIPLPWRYLSKEQAAEILRRDG
jgi:protein-S-isoprenylcysteine O-methyltransferase Ste14